MAEFKIGDIVVASAGAPYAVTTKGWKGRIIDIKGQDFIHVVSLAGFAGCDGWVNPKYFYKETEKMTKFEELNLGDLVRGNASARGYGVTTEGWVGVVIDKQAATKEIRVAGPGLTSRGAWVSPDAFDVFYPETTTVITQGVPEIKDVIFNKPATIVIWADDTKTIVKCGEGEKYDPEKGLALCISKKTLGNKYEYYEPFKKWLGKYNKQKEKKAAKKATTAKKKAVAKKVTPAKKTAAKKATPKKSAKTTTKRTTKK